MTRLYLRIPCVFLPLSIQGTHYELIPAVAIDEGGGRGGGGRVRGDLRIILGRNVKKVVEFCRKYVFWNQRKKVGKCPPGPTRGGRTPPGPPWPPRGPPSRFGER